MTLIPVTYIGQQIILFSPATVMVTHGCIQWLKLLCLKPCTKTIFGLDLDTDKIVTVILMVSSSIQTP